jgi:secondary thiamine-phosphate synthase enzyme
MKIFQKEILLPSFRRGYHLITEHIVREFPEIKNINSGLLHIHLKHTSAGLTINENADPTVRQDFETQFNRIIPDSSTMYVHDTEGTDDMPAHIKSSIVGYQLTIPVTAGRMNLGIWQGIYLCEFRNRGGQRKLVLTVQGND